MAKNRIENFTSIMNFINDYEGKVTWHDVIQYCLDYDMYKELYLNHFIYNHLIIEHNEAVSSGTWTRSN